MLGSRTESKVSFGSGRPDTRAAIIKAVSGLTHNISSDSFTIGGGGVSGINNWDYRTYNEPAYLYDLGSQLLTQQNNQAISAGGVSGINQDQPSRMLLENTHVVYDFFNRATSACTLKVYFCHAKQDLYLQIPGPGGSPVNVMNYTSPVGLVYDWSGQPISAIQQGVAAAENAGPGATTYLDVGIVPTSSPIFNQYFTIHREQEIEFAIGGSHRLEWNRSYDKVLDASHYGNPAMGAVRGITEFVLFQAWGQPSVQTATGLVTTSLCSIGCVVTNNTRVRCPPASFTTTIMNNNVSQSSAATTSISGATGTGTVNAAI